MCESCGRGDEQLSEVRRVYLLKTDDGSEQVSPLDDLEHWCAACCATYPHIPV